MLSATVIHSFDKAKTLTRPRLQQKRVVYTTCIWFLIWRIEFIFDLEHWIHTHTRYFIKFWKILQYIVSGMDRAFVYKQM